MHGPKLPNCRRYNRNRGPERKMAQASDAESWTFKLFGHSSAREPHMRRVEVGVVHRAVMTHSHSVVKQAIANGEDIEMLDGLGRSPLFYAVQDGDISVISELLEHGADPNKPDKNGEVPLHFAAREFRSEAARMLLKHGAVVDAQDEHGNTPLGHAVFDSRGRGEMIKLLLSSGADRTLKNKHDVSPLELANTIANFNVRQFFNG